MNNNFSGILLASFVACAGSLTAAVPAGSHHAHRSPTIEVRWPPTEPCDAFEKIQRPGVGDVGVNLADLTPQWADAYTKAFQFWNKILKADLHRDDNLSSCAVKIIAPLGVLPKNVLALTQSPDAADFAAETAINPERSLTDRKMLIVAAHELGHLLGLPDNSLERDSLMWSSGFRGEQVLSKRDLLYLSAKHSVSTMAMDVIDGRSDRIHLFPPIKPVREVPAPVNARYHL